MGGLFEVRGRRGQQRLHSVIARRPPAGSKKINSLRATTIGRHAPELRVKSHSLNPPGLHVVSIAGTPSSIRRRNRASRSCRTSELPEPIIFHPQCQSACQLLLTWPRDPAAPELHDHRQHLLSIGRAHESARRLSPSSTLQFHQSVLPIQT